MPMCIASPKNRALLAFRINQGISASFSLLLSRPPGSGPLKDQQWAKARVGLFERIALKLVYYHMRNRQCNLIHEAGCSKLAHWDSPEGWDGEGGKGGSGWRHIYTHGRFMSMHGKNHYNIVK